jgi:hypothetical protein
LFLLKRSLISDKWDCVTGDSSAYREPATIINEQKKHTGKIHWKNFFMYFSPTT